MSGGLLEAAVLAAIPLWFAFYVVNHAEITAKIRSGLYPVLPKWAVSLATCPLCTTFWTLTAYSLLFGFTPLVLYTPVVVLFIDLAYRRLANSPSQ